MEKLQSKVPDVVEVPCNWCGAKVEAYLAHCHRGSFYHKNCDQERLDYDRESTERLRHQNTL